VAVFLTFHLVSAAWIFFRAESFTKARLVFDQLFTFTTHHPNLDARIVLVLALGFLSHFVPRSLYEQAKAGFQRLPAPALAVVLFGVLVVLRAVASSEAVPFVYFQF
jgi:hypothetical protein